MDQTTKVKSNDPSPRTKACVSDIIRQELLRRLGSSPFMPKADIENYVEKKLREALLVRKYAAGYETPLSDLTNTESEDVAGTSHQPSQLSTETVATERSEPAQLESGTQTSSEVISTTTNESSDAFMRLSETIRHVQEKLCSIQNQVLLNADLERKMQKYVQERIRESQNEAEENTDLVRTKAVTRIPARDQTDMNTNDGRALPIVALHTKPILPEEKLTCELQTYITNVVREEINTALAQINFVDHFATEKDVMRIIQECLNYQNVAEEQKILNEAPATVSPEKAMDKKIAPFVPLHLRVREGDESRKALQNPNPMHDNYLGTYLDEANYPPNVSKVTNQNKSYETETRCIEHEGQHVYVTKRVRTDNDYVDIYCPFSGPRFH